METIKLNFEVNSIKVNTAQLKAVGTLVGAFRDLQKAIKAANTDLQKMQKTTQD